jgi:hypothetical protein
MTRPTAKVRPRDLILLWSRAAGRCSHPDCKQALIVEAEKDDDAATVGQAAHIVARSTGGPRGRESRPHRLHGYENLILLCAHHHSIADQLPKSHSTEILHTWKAEHEAWVVAAMAPSAAVPWIAILQDPEARADAVEAEKAMGRGNYFAGRLDLSISPDGAGWSEAARRQAERIERTIAGTPPERRRFAVFPLGRIPLAIHLGYSLGDRARAEVYHYDRDRGSWGWDPAAHVEEGLALRIRKGRGKEANLAVSLSAGIDPADLPAAGTVAEIAAPHPSVRWLRTRDQLRALARHYEQALAALRARDCRRIHVFYAGPAAGAFELGRAYNPRMNPPLALYEFRRAGRPRYEKVLELNSER